eukprot:2923111-Rhodomonas_salina.1
MRNSRWANSASFLELPISPYTIDKLRYVLATSGWFSPCDCRSRSSACVPRSRPQYPAPHAKQQTKLPQAKQQTQKQSSIGAFPSRDLRAQRRTLQEMGLQGSWEAPARSV